MTPAELARIGRTVYRAEWHQRMAERLGVTRRTVERWHKGTHAVDARYTERIRKLLDVSGK